MCGLISWAEIAEPAATAGPVARKPLREILSFTISKISSRVISEFILHAIPEEQDKTLLSETNIIFQMFAVFKSIVEVDEGRTLLLHYGYLVARV